MQKGGNSKSYKSAHATYMVANTVFLVILVSALLVVVNRVNYKYQMKQFDEYVSGSVQQTADYLNIVFNDRLQDIETISYLYGANLSTGGKNADYLKQLEEQSGFDVVRYIDADGTLYTSGGLTADVSEKEYFKDGMKGNSGVAFVEESCIDQETLIGAYAPVFRDGTVSGIMTGFMTVDTVSDILKTDIFGYPMDTLIINADGIVLGQYRYEDVALIDNIREWMTEEKSIDIATLKEREVSTGLLTAKRGESVGAWCLIPGTSNVLVQIFPPEVANSQIHTVYHNELWALALLVCIIAWFAYQGIFLYKRQAKAVQQRKTEEKITTILNHLTDDFLCLIDVNLNTRQEEQFRILQGFAEEDWAQGNYDYTHCIENYAREIVSDKDRSFFLTATRLENLTSTLQRQKDFYIEYEAVISEKPRRLQGRFTMVTDNPKEPHILIGIRDITESTQEKAKLQIAMDLIVSAASTVYPFILEENLTRNMARTIYNQGIVHKGRMEEMSLDDMLAGLRETIVIEEDYEKLHAVMNAKAQMQAYHAGQREMIQRIRQLGDDGALHWMEVRNILMENTNGDIYSISMARCIDDEIARTKELEAAKETAESANRAKSIFLFNMSHDIRTPMNAIMGFSAMAEKYIDDPEKIQDCLKKINLSGDHLLGLINSVLDMARIESGKMELQIKAHHIPTEIQNMNCVFQMDLQRKHLTYESTCDIQDEIAFYDVLRVNQIKMNLIGNAIKYTPDGGTITYSLKQTAADGQNATYEMRVKDTGIGMSEEFRESMFEAFERENSGVVVETQGSGLGLSITKGLVSQMGGSIDCISELQKGTEFICVFTFPIGTAADLQDEDAVSEVRLNSKGKRVLLVEDNALNREISRFILEERGFIVEEAEDGDVAVAAVRNSAPGYYDLILMDIQMPRMNGYEATKEIRSLENQALAQIPIIAVTANAFEEDRKQAFAVGMNGHVAKPIRIEALEKELSKLMLD